MHLFYYVYVAYENCSQCLHYNEDGSHFLQYWLAAKLASSNLKWSRLEIVGEKNQNSFQAKIFAMKINLGVSVHYLSDHDMDFTMFSGLFLHRWYYTHYTFWWKGIWLSLFNADLNSMLEIISKGYIQGIQY